MSEKFLNFRGKCLESSIGFENVAYLQSIENKYKYFAFWLRLENSMLYLGHESFGTLKQ